MPAIDDEPISNRSDNPAFADIVESRLSRRGLLLGGLGAAAVTFLSGCHVVDGRPMFRPAPGGGASRLLGFRAVPPSTADQVVVPEGYATQVLIPWGTPIVPSGPAFRRDASNSAAEQAQQVGMNHDGMWYFPLPGADGNRRGLLVVNNEYTDDHLLFPDGTERWSAEKTEKSMNAHGVTIVEIAAEGGTWAVVDSSYARRITASTPMTFSGPAAGHRLLRTALDLEGRSVEGTINNCAMGVTPWGTYLTCEENFNGYFQYRGEAPPGEVRDLNRRYGITATGAGYRWATTHERWRADVHPNQPNKFGWVVEIDPFDPASTPVKRTALGRLKHEDASVHVARDGRVVVYMGDDQVNEYLYKFVSAERADHPRFSGRAQSPLDEGTLHVARFGADGRGRWIPLVHGSNGLTAANGFADQADVLVKTRLAADRVGATPMDRPEWTAVDPDSGTVYLTLTNNTSRTTPDAPNPRVSNRWGHIVRWDEDGGDHTATAFSWDLFLLAGPGGGVDGSTVLPEDAFGSPDGLWVDPDRRAWIQTDGTQPGSANNQMLVADASAPYDVEPELRRFLTGVKGCEVTGIATTPDRRTLFVNLQHPGENGGSTWPRLDGITVPRSATVVITKDDGGVVGT